MRRRPTSNLLIGGCIGLAAGAALGATVLSSVFGRAWGDEGPAAEIIGLGLAGAALGAGSAWLLAPKAWQEIPLTSRGIAPAPLDRESPRTQWSRMDRWKVFTPTYEDFAAFFTAWVDNLDPIEGIWDLEASGSQMHGRVAIVRDSRYQGYEYVSVRLRSPFRGPDRADGVIIWALRRSERVGEYELAYPASRAQSRYDRAVLTPSELVIRRVDSFERWTRTVPASPIP